MGFCFDWPLPIYIYFMCKARCLPTITKLFQCLVCLFCSIQAEASKAIESGGAASKAGQGPAVTSNATAGSNTGKSASGGGGTGGTAAAAAAAGGGHALLAALLASDRYLGALVSGTGRLWAACEAVRYFV